ncbi:DUF945 family protein [Vandammella animalimorsus]|uniref:DUF945 family protein n=2 Tax=Vandammella animalimorsus TaxID=2029117 RepID=A0A3M6RSC6_9BURK|nr:DUF945 family protein [Vandammella animalimorsus]
MPRTVKTWRNGRPMGKKMVGAGLLLAALLGLGYSAAAWYVGVQTQQHVQQAHAEFSAALGVSAQLTQYQRGLFHSSARSVVRIESPQQGAAPAAVTAPQPWRGQTIVLEHRIRHLPLLAAPHRAGWVAVRSTPVLSPAAQAALRPSLGDAPPYVLDAVLGYRGSVHWRLAGPAWQRPWEDAQGAAQTLHMRPLHWEGELGPDGRSLRSALQWGGMTLQNAQGVQLLHIEQLHGRDDYHRPAGLQHSYLGQSRYSLGQWQQAGAQGAQAGGWQVQGLALAFDIQPQDGQWLRLPLQVQMQQLRMAGDGTQAQASQASSQLTLSALEFKAAVEQLHQPSYEALGPWGWRWLLAHMGASTAWEQLPLAEQGQVRERLAALLAQGLRLTVERLAGQLPQGQWALSGQASAPKLHAIDLGFLPHSLLAKLHASVQLEIAQPLALHWQGQENLELLVQQGLVRQEAGQIRTVLQYQGGHSSINGHPFDLRGIDQLLQ